jgi:hypothetical protein
MSKRRSADGTAAPLANLVATRIVPKVAGPIGHNPIVPCDHLGQITTVTGHLTRRKMAAKVVCSRSHFFVAKAGLRPRSRHIIVGRSAES